MKRASPKNIGMRRRRLVHQVKGRWSPLAKSASTEKVIERGLVDDQILAGPCRGWADRTHRVECRTQLMLSAKLYEMN